MGGKGAFAGSTQTRQPDDAAAMSIAAGTFYSGDFLASGVFRCNGKFTHVSANSQHLF
jgi:hypothetical protein